MKNWNMERRMATVLSPTPHFPQVTITSLGRYVSHSKLGKSSLEILLNGSTYSNSHGQYFPIVKLRSGECGNCRGVLGGSGYPWGSRIWKREPTSLKVVFAFTTFARDWLESIRSRMFMFLYGVRVIVGGSGKGLKISYFLTNGNTTVSGLFMFKKNGIKRYLRLI
jgi:hypothetical protein